MGRSFSYQRLPIKFVDGSPFRRYMIAINGKGTPIVEEVTHRDIYMARAFYFPGSDRYYRTLRAAMSAWHRAGYPRYRKMEIG